MVTRKKTKNDEAIRIGIEIRIRRITKTSMKPPRDLRDES